MREQGPRGQIEAKKVADEQGCDELREAVAALQDDGDGDAGQSYAVRLGGGEGGSLEAAEAVYLRRRKKTTVFEFEFRVEEGRGHTEALHLRSSGTTKLG